MSACFLEFRDVPGCKLFLLSPLPFRLFWATILCFARPDRLQHPRHELLARPLLKRFNLTT